MVFNRKSHYSTLNQDEKSELLSIHYDFPRALSIIPWEAFKPISEGIGGDMYLVVNQFGRFVVKENLTKRAEEDRTFLKRKNDVLERLVTKGSDIILPRKNVQGEYQTDIGVAQLEVFDYIHGFTVAESGKNPKFIMRELAKLDRFLSEETEEFSKFWKGEIDESTIDRMNSYRKELIPGELGNNLLIIWQDFMTELKSYVDNGPLALAEQLQWADGNRYNMIYGGPDGSTLYFLDFDGMQNLPRVHDLAYTLDRLAMDRGNFHHTDKDKAKLGLDSYLIENRLHDFEVNQMVTHLVHYSLPNIIGITDDIFSGNAHRNYSLYLQLLDVGRMRSMEANLGLGN